MKTIRMDVCGEKKGDSLAFSLFSSDLRIFKAGKEGSVHFFV